MNPSPDPTNHTPTRRQPLFLSIAAVILFFVTALGLFCLQVPSVYAQNIDSDSPQGNAGPLQVEATPSQTPDKYYADYFAHSWDIPEEASAGNNFWIEVNLRTQTLYAYRGNQIINAFLISSGTSAFPTVTGTYQIYAKYSQYTMRGPDYDIPDVPYTMFFYKGYSIHGTYWHNNFGTPMSRGCVNMNTEEAAWIYENAPVGTYVFIHN
jgi:lipoprotein-anchoring transpeptidase ErfK/SrfK